MKKSGAILLQIVIVLIGIGALVFMLWEPHIEGRNVNATLFEIYFNDLFLACAYIASIPFFVALYKAFKILGYVRQNNTFTQETAKALRTIRYCGTTLVAFIVAAEVYLFIFQRGKDDITGGVFMGLLMIVASGIIATTASMFEGILQDVLSVNPKTKLTA